MGVGESVINIRANLTLFGAKNNKKGGAVL